MAERVIEGEEAGEREKKGVGIRRGRESGREARNTSVSDTAEVDLASRLGST